jgi:single-stranded DNA-binding protein
MTTARLPVAPTPAHAVIPVGFDRALPRKAELMALPELRGIGRLLTDPRTGTSQNGNPWTSVLVKFAQWRKTDDGWQEGDGQVASCIAFGDVAAEVARFAKGDEIELRGPAHVEMYQDKPQLKVTVVACRVPVKTDRTNKAAA